MSASFFSVVDYGTIGDGVTDDSTAIQNALNASIGGICYVPSNASYYVNTTLTIPANTTLIFESYTATFIHGCDVTSTHLILLSTNATIKNATINGNYTNVTTFSQAEIAANGANCVIENCFVYNLRNVGISGGFDHCKIRDNFVLGLYSSTIGSYGIWAIVPSSINQEISGNTVTGTYIDAIGVSGVNAKVFNNYIKGCQCNTSIGGGQLAIYPMSANTGFVKVYDNHIGAGGSSISSGIELNGHSKVYNNFITKQKASGIVLQAGNWNIVHDNIVSNCGAEGIVTTSNLAFFEIYDNTCFDDQTIATQTYGVRIEANYNNYYKADNNMCYSNTISNFADQTTNLTNKKVGSNLGNSVMNVLSVGASPYTYTNTRGQIVMLSIYGGTGVSVTANGRSVAYNNGVQVLILPMATAVITYTISPGIDEFGITD
jgi:hypothetical protein